MDESAEREWLLARAVGARRRYEARLARLAREADEQRRREDALLQQTSGDAVEAAIARALARRKPSA